MIFKSSFKKIVLVILHVFLSMSLSRETPPCDCHYDVGMAFCFHVRACPEFVSIARVECAINEISLKPNTSLDQVLIHGDCQNISEYMRLCMYEINVIMMQSTGERFLCSGNFNFKKCNSGSIQTFILLVNTIIADMYPGGGWLPLLLVGPVEKCWSAFGYYKHI